VSAAHRFALRRARDDDGGDAPFLFQRRDAREKAVMINSRRKTIINGHLLVPYSSKMAGFCAEIGLIGFVSAGNASVFGLLLTIKC